MMPGIPSDKTWSSNEQADANVLHSPSSTYSKERASWEAYPSVFGQRPGRPYQFRPYPMMMHKAGPPESGMGPIEIRFSEIAESEAAAKGFLSRGFRETPLEALAAYEAEQLEFAKLAAEQNYDVKHRLSAKAGAEVEAAQDAHDGHLPAVPVTPIRKRIARVKKESS